MRGYYGSLPQVTTAAFRTMPVAKYRLLALLDHSGEVVVVRKGEMVGGKPWPGPGAPHGEVEAAAKLIASAGRETLVLEVIEKYTPGE